MHKVLSFFCLILLIVLIESFVVCINVIPKYKECDLRMSTVAHMMLLIFVFFVSDIVAIVILAHCLF